MQPNPFDALIHSRKFWLAMLDAVFSTVATLLTMFLAPAQVDKILTVIGLWQPVLVVVIGAIAYEDGQKIKADAQAGLSRPK